MASRDQIEAELRDADTLCRELERPLRAARATRNGLIVQAHEAGIGKRQTARLAGVNVSYVSGILRDKDLYAPAPEKPKSIDDLLRRAGAPAERPRPR